MEWKSWHLWEGSRIHHRTRGWEPSWAKYILQPESQTQAGLPMFYLSLINTRASFLSFSLKISSMCFSDTWNRKLWLPSYTLQLPAPAPRPASQGSGVTHRFELGIHLCVKKTQHDGNEETTQPWRQGQKQSPEKRNCHERWSNSEMVSASLVSLWLYSGTVQQKHNNTRPCEPHMSFNIFPAGALQEYKETD